MQAVALMIVLATVPIGALLAGKLLDFAAESSANIFTKLSFPLAAVVALYSPIFPDTLTKALNASQTNDVMGLLLRSITAAGVFGGVTASILTIFILAAEIPFRWGAEKIVPTINALRPAAILFLFSLTFYRIVDLGELIFSRYLNG